MLQFWLKGRREVTANSMQMWASNLQETLKHHMFHQIALVVQGREVVTPWTKIIQWRKQERPNLCII